MTTILIVDDEPDILITLHLALSLEGYEIVGAANGAEALQRISEHRPDLVICDIAMPELDGLQVCGRLRCNPATRHIPIILTSSLELEPGGEENWDVFLRKPADVSELLRAIKKLLRPTGPSD